MAPGKMQKKTFIRSGEGAIASYDWTDTASGQGFISFYGFGTGNRGASAYNLGSKILPSYPNQIPITGSTYGTEANWFSFIGTTFKSPQILEGIGYLRCRWTFGASYAGTQTGYLTFTIYHVRGAVETQIGIAETENQSSSGAVTRVENLKVSFTKTNFAIGDYIKIKVGRTSSRPTDNYFIVYFDPLDADNYFLLNIPFKIDL
jgi:hypothetical protein